MNDAVNGAPAVVHPAATSAREEPRTLLVLLDGGPYRVPTATRVSWASAMEGKIKLSRAGGYDHFQRVDGTTPGTPMMFVWTMRTRVAE